MERDDSRFFDPNYEDSNKRKKTHNAAAELITGDHNMLLENSSAKNHNPASELITGDKDRLVNIDEDPMIHDGRDRFIHDKDALLDDNN